MKFFNFSEIRHNLTQVGNKEPLNWFSILVLIALDIFIIYNLFAGLETQTRQLTRPSEKVPYQCQNDAVLPDTDSSKISKIRGWVNYKPNYNERIYYSNIEYKKEEKRIQECVELEKITQSVYDNRWLSNKFDRISNLQNDISSYQNIMERVRNDYDTNLLEKIAGQNAENSITENDAWKSKDKIRENDRKIQTARAEIRTLENEILADAQVNKIFNFIEFNGPKILETYEKENFWYSLKLWGVKALFLIPLFLIFWFLYQRASRKGSSISTLIYSHALAITTIPIFWGILEFIYDIIPQKFLANFLKILEDLNLEVLIFPLMILGGILGAMFLIYIVQKKLFNKQKTRLKRISKKQCPYCGVGISENDLYCYNCGEVQYTKCVQCGKYTKKEGLYCIHCGSEEFNKKQED